jgi:hypothetical protein
MIVFLGDFNYRLDDISYDEARDFVSQRCFDWLRERDQLRAEMDAGNAFQGMREAIITFPPTYKFERHQAGLAGWYPTHTQTRTHTSIQKYSLKTELEGELYHQKVKKIK